MTKKKVKPSREMIVKLAGQIVKRVTITEKISKQFEKEGWKQNEYWEYEDGVMCASFINIDLDQLSVFIDEKLDEEIEDEKIKT